MTFEITGGAQLPEGRYLAILESVEPYDHATYGKGRKWSFLADVPGGEVTSITGLTSDNTGPQSKAFAWLTALLGEAPKAGSRVEPPIGKRCYIDVKLNDKGFSKIEAVSTYVEAQQTIPGVPR